MPELTTSGFCPTFSKIYFNCEREIGQLLAEFGHEAHRSESRYICLCSNNEVTPQKVLLHAAEVLPELLHADIGLFWYTFYQHTGVASFALALRNFLASLWRGEEPGDEPHVGELAVLAFDFEDYPSIEDYFRFSILPLVTKVLSKRVLIALELKMDSRIESTDLRDALELLDLIQKKVVANPVTVVILCSEGVKARLPFFLGRLNPIKIPEAPPYIQEVLDKVDIPAQPRSEPRTRAKKRRQGGDRIEIAKIIHPLALLNSAATKCVVDYIKDRVLEADREIPDLIRRHMLVGLRDEGLALTQNGVQFSRDTFLAGHKLGIHGDIVPNGAKILSFMAPETLADESPTGSYLDGYIRESFRVVDLFTALMTKRFTSKETDDDLLSALREAVSWAPAFQKSNEIHHRIVITYLSQLLIRPRYELDHQFFQVLEDLAYGLATFLTDSYQYDLEKSYNASRIVTGLGYVYDKMCEGRRTAGFLPRTRERIFSHAAQVLQELRPVDLPSYAKVQYSLGWQLLDAERREEAAKVFSDTALELFKRSKPAPDGFQWGFTQMAYMLAFLAYIVSDRKQEDSLREILEDFIIRYGIVHSLADLDRFLSGDATVLDVGERFACPNPSINVYVCRYDFFLGIMHASTLFFHENVPVRLIVVHKKDDIDSFLAGATPEHRILGAPDTPEGVGEWISSFSPQIHYLYQLRLMDSFYGSDTFHVEGKRVIIQGGCGIGSPAEHSDSSGSRKRSKKEGLRMTGVPELIASSILIPVLKTAGEKMASLFIEKIAERMQKRSADIQAPVVEEEIDDLKRDLENLQVQLSAEQDLPPASINQFLKLDQRSSLVKTLFAEQLRDSDLIDTLRVVVREMGDLDLEPEDAWHLSGVMCGVVQELRQRHPEIPGALERELGEFQEAFLNYRSSFRTIVDKWRIHQELKYEQYNSILNRFSRTVQQFFRSLDRIVKTP